MLKTAFCGFCMSLADGVPGVSGSTVAFIMGFYERFVTAVNDLIYGSLAEKKNGLIYLLKLGVGWIAGMALVVLALNALFATHIYFVYSLFAGLTVGGIPVIIAEEKECLCQWRRAGWCFIAGLTGVVMITFSTTLGEIPPLDLVKFDFFAALRMFFTGIAASCAMILPGISGSTVLLISGSYIPILKAAHELLNMRLGTLPGVICFAAGAIVGIAMIIRPLKTSLRKYRSQMIYLILGMMAGSVYSIMMGPANMTPARQPLSAGNFDLIGAAAGAVLVLALQAAKEVRKHGGPAGEGSQNA